MTRTSPAKPDSVRQLVLGLLGYCPGTGIVALAQGNHDAIAGILGLIVGSHFYAETSGQLASTILKVGYRGGIMLPDVLGCVLLFFLRCSSR